MCLERCRDGILSEKTCLLYTPPIPFTPLASVATSGFFDWVVSWKLQTRSQGIVAINEGRLWLHRGIRILRKRRRPLQ